MITRARWKWILFLAAKWFYPHTFPKLFVIPCFLSLLAPQSGALRISTHQCWATNSWAIGSWATGSWATMQLSNRKLSNKEVEQQFSWATGSWATGSWATKKLSNNSVEQQEVDQQLLNFLLLNFFVAQLPVAQLHCCSTSCCSSSCCSTSCCSTLVSGIDLPITFWKISCQSQWRWRTSPRRCWERFSMSFFSTKDC